MQRHGKLVAFFVVLAVVLVYAGSLSGGFVYDDHRFIEHNEAIRSIPLFSAFTDPATTSHREGIKPDIYRPLRTLFFSVEFALFAGESDDGGIDFHLPWWHAVSVLLHAFNALLVLWLLRPLFRGAQLPAFLGALLFALHPLSSESVAWLSSQGDLLAMTFGLGALVVLERRGRGRTLLGVLLFALACLSKESALVLPALLVLRDVALPRGQAEARGPWARTTWLRAGTLMGVVVLYFVVRHQVMPGLAQVEHPGGSVLASARGMLHGLVWYAGGLLWPSGFSFDARLDVPHHWSDPVVVLGLGLLLSTLLAGLFGLVRRRTVLAFSTLGFLILLGPVSNVIVPLKAFVADRFIYPGLVCAAAGVMAAVFSLKGTLRMAALTVTVFAIGTLGLLTIQRNAAWANEVTLWETVLTDRPANTNAYQGLAFQYATQRRVADAERAYASYLEANPNDGKSLRVMGDLFGEMAEGIFEVTHLGGETSHQLRHRQARVAQIKLYQRALRIWDAPGGLALGRGSERMRLEMLDKWIEAGVDLGDVMTARYANDRAIDLEARGQGYTHADAEIVMSRAAWPRRRVRVLLAQRAIQAATQREMPEELRAQLVAARRVVLLDISLNPDHAPQTLLGPLQERVEALIRSAFEEPDIQPDPHLFLELAALLVGRGFPERARGALQEGLKVHPGHVLLLQNLHAIESQLSGRRPR